MGNGRFKYRNAKRDDAPPTFWLSTKNVQEYMQERIDMIVATLRKRSERYSRLENIPVTIAGVQASDKIGSFAVVLPPDALEAEATNVDGIPSIYLQKDEEAELMLIPEIENFFKLYAYSKWEKKDFEDADFRKRYNVSRQTAETLINFSVPRYRKVDGDDHDTDIVMFFINPITVFHDMLTEEGEKRESFEIQIDAIKKIRNAEYEYHVRKLRKKRKHGNRGGNVDKELDSFLRRRH